PVMIGVGIDAAVLVGPFLHVGTGGEGATSAGHDQGPQRLGLGRLADRLAQPDQHAGVDGVTRLRAVDRDDAHGAGILDLHDVGHGRLLELAPWEVRVSRTVNGAAWTADGRSAARWWSAR